MGSQAEPPLWSSTFLQELTQQSKKDPCEKCGKTEESLPVLSRL